MTDIILNPPRSSASLFHVKIKTLSAIVVSLLFIPTHSMARDHFFDRHSEGWYWYETIVKPEKKEIPPETKPKTDSEPEGKKEINIVTLKKETEETHTPKEPIATEKPPTPPGPVPGSSQWLKDNWPKILQAAMDNPSTENVWRAAATHRLMTDKADKFSDMWTLVHASNPYLDQNNRRASTSTINEVVGDLKREKKRELVKTISTHHPYVFFYRSNEVLSGSMSVNLDFMKTKHNMDITAVSLDDTALPNGLFPDWIPDKGKSQALNVMSTPALYLFQVDNKEWIPITMNYMDVSTLEDRIIDISYMGGVISEEEWRSPRDEQNPYPMMQDSITQPNEIRNLEYDEFFTTLKRNIENGALN